ncbi:MAG: zinc metalloprotease HtpX [Actinomycetota bacterium]
MTRLDATALARHRRRNFVQSALVLAGIAGLTALAGWLVADTDGIAWAVFGVGLILLLQPASSPVMLRALWGAVPLSPAAAPGLSGLVAELSRRADLERPPQLHYIPRGEIIALSTGWGRTATLAVSRGLLDAMTPREVAAVLAHEVSHLRHGDLQVLRLAEAAGRLTRMLALFGLLMVALYLPAALAMGAGVPVLPVLLLVAAPPLSDLMLLKLSRTREFAADAGAAQLTGDPVGLMLALERLDRLQGGDWERVLAGRFRWLTLVRTHPGTDERLARLAELAPAPRPAWIAFPDLLLPIR